MRAYGIILSAALLCAFSAAALADLGLYEWSAVAPIVVGGESLGDDGRYVEFRVDRVLRGNVHVDDVLRIDLKHANVHRDRDLYPKRRRLDQGSSYVLLLERWLPPKQGKPPFFRPVRGILGIGDLPAEGSEAFLDALETLTGIQDQQDERIKWRELTRLLEQTDPVLLQTSLYQFVKFRRGEVSHLPIIRPLLNHPTEKVREDALVLVSQILQDEDLDTLPDESGLLRDLVARARRDPSVPVRLAATDALAGFDDERVDRVMEEIAEDDEDQDVRYAAEKILFDRRRRNAADDQTGER